MPPSSPQGGPGAHPEAPAVGEGNAITDLLAACQRFLEAYGWYMVLVLLALYMLQPHILRLRAELSLRQANNPTRRKILDEERKRVRLQQQVDLLRAKERAEEEAAAARVLPNDEEKDTPKAIPPAATLKKRPVVKKPAKKPSPSSSDYNPLLGGGGGSSFRPSSSARNQGIGRRKG